MTAELGRFRALSGARLDELAAQARTQLNTRRTELHAEIHSVTAVRDRLHAELAVLRAAVVETNDTALLQEAGIYDYRHPLATAIAYKQRLADIKTRTAALARDGAVRAATDWSVNGSLRDGKKMIRDFSKLMLRAYNAEADTCIRTVRPHTLPALIARLTKTKDVIARLGVTMNISITTDYHRLRVTEIELTADHMAKLEEEKEQIRAERERQREEDKAHKEFEREKARLLKERAHYQSALAALTTSPSDMAVDTDAAPRLRAQLASIDDAISGVESREANIRAGYVYVISNIGSFGPDVVKIGLTRRLDPNDRIRELGDASVPFKFDTHAIVFSDDAVGLETRLHHEFSAVRVNAVNMRREFFRTTPAAVRDTLTRIAGQHLLEFTETPEALEWRASTPPTSSHVG